LAVWRSVYESTCKLIRIPMVSETANRPAARRILMCIYTFSISSPIFFSVLIFKCRISKRVVSFCYFANVYIIVFIIFQIPWFSNLIWNFLNCSWLIHCTTIENRRKIEAAEREEKQCVGRLFCELDFFVDCVYFSRQKYFWFFILFISKIDQ